MTKKRIDQGLQEKGNKKEVRKTSLSKELIDTCEKYGFKTVYLFQDGEHHFSAKRAERRVNQLGKKGIKIKFTEEKV